MNIRSSTKFEKQLRKLPKLSQIIILRKITLLESEHSKSVKLKNHKCTYRLRVGKFRVIYKLEKGNYYIEAVGHRKDIYEHLKNILSLLLM